MSPHSPPALAWHVTARLRRDRPLAAGPGSSRQLARLVLRHAHPASGQPPDLLAFSVPDTHLHLLLACDRNGAGRFVNHLLGALARHMKLDGGFEGAWFGAVGTQGHLRSSFHYVLRQHSRHETTHDPFREASNLQDLLGLRTLGAYTKTTAQRMLPRLRRDQLLPHLGVERLSPGRNVSLLAEAAAAAIGRRSPLAQDRESIEAKAAAIRWGLANGCTKAWLAEHLGISRRTLYRLLHQDPKPTILFAIAGQIGLRERGQARLSA